jgi:hypothetical protein
MSNSFPSQRYKDSKTRFNFDLPATIRDSKT